MTQSASGPTLTDAQGMGGVNAQSGFDYQIWDGLVRLPYWLRNPAFEGMAFETLEDLEARFFSPHAPQRCLLERYQAKAGEQSKTELAKVFQSFLSFEKAYPEATRVHTLVTPSLPATLKWIATDGDRSKRPDRFTHLLLVLTRQVAISFEAIWKPSSTRRLRPS